MMDRILPILMIGSTTIRMVSTKQRTIALSTVVIATAAILVTARYLWYHRSSMLRGQAVVVAPQVSQADLASPRYVL
jgi:hypothetical protein